MKKNIDEKRDDRGLKNEYVYPTFKNVDELLKSNFYVIEDITTIEKKREFNATITTHKVSAYGPENEENVNDLYTYELIEIKDDLGSSREEIWQLNGEDHRMGLYPARSFYDYDGTEQFVDLRETIKESYSVNGVKINDIDFKLSADADMIKKGVIETSKDNTIVMRQGEIILIPKQQKAYGEVSFDSKKEAITYQVATGNTHNFTDADKKILSENFKEITSKAYKNYPQEVQKSKSEELNNDIKKNPLIEKVKSFCKARDAKQKAPEKSLGMER